MPPPKKEQRTEIFPGGSTMARLMRQWDWSGTPLGPPDRWPDGLKIPLKMLLTSRFEMWLGWGPDLLFFYNDAYIPTLGLKHPSMLGKPFREVWKEVYHEVADQVESVRRGQATWNKALLLLLERSGYPEETYHSFSYSPLYGEGTEVEGLYCVVSEDTERVINERRIDMLRKLGMELVTAGDKTEISAAVCKVLSDNRWDFPFALMRLNGEEFPCSDDATHLLRRIWPVGDHARALATPHTLKLPDEFDYPTGAWNIPPVEGIAVPILAAVGREPLGALFLGLNPHRRDDPRVMDIARLMAGQISGALANVEALQSERRRANRIWSHARDLMAVVSADGVFRSVSPAWTRILGYALEDVVGHHLDEFIHPDDLDHSIEALEQALDQIDLTGFENRLKTQDGNYRWISWHTSKEEGVIYAYGRDVTQQKANAAALTAAEDALRQAQKMEAIGQLTGGIAHDFNNLLTGILGSLEMMKRRNARGDATQAERYTSAAIACANRAAALTQRLLAFSRQQSLDPRIVDATELVAGMEELIRRSIGEATTFDLRSTPDLWSTKCDPNQLESAVLNLVINARDAMPNGGHLIIETANVEVDMSEAAVPGHSAPGDYVVVSVSDTGEGMSPEVSAKVFEPFFTTKPIGQGTGLGLSMIYGFVRQSGGFVELESEVNLGTTVKLYLPRAKGVGSGPKPASESLRRADRLRKPASVLVVEDEPMVRALVVDALTDLGFEAVEAYDGQTGLDHLRSDEHFDLLISDVGLPGSLNGRQLADAARHLRPGLRVLFMTGYAHNAAVGEGQLEPGMEIITKPFAVDALVDRVRMILATP